MRQRTAGAMTILFVTRRLLSTASRIFSISPSLASRPDRSIFSSTLFSASSFHWRNASVVDKSVALRSCDASGVSILMVVKVDDLPRADTPYDQRRIWAFRPSGMPRWRMCLKECST